MEEDLKNSNLTSEETSKLKISDFVFKYVDDKSEKEKIHAFSIHENAVEHIEELYFIFPFNFSTNFTFLLIL
jgi:hypothetical protein